MKMGLRIYKQLILIVLLNLSPAIILGPSPCPAQAGRFDESCILEHIKFLASDDLEGRMGGSRGAQVASEYIKDRFKKLSLKPCGEDGSFFQEFTFVSDVIPGELNGLVVKCRGKTFTGNPGTDFFPMGSTANTTAEGRLVFIGYGLRNQEKGHDDFAGVDLEGAVAIAIEGIPAALEGTEESGSKLLIRKKAMLAREAGAIGLIIIRDKDSQEPIDQMKYDGIPGDVGIAYARLSWEFAEQILVCGGLPATSPGSVPPSQVLDNMSAKLRTDVFRKRATGRNVLALLHGTDKKLRDQYVVVGAHHDHIGTGTAEDGSRIIYNGADDNASGVAGLLELAAALSVTRPRRSILLLSFDAEELGALGSLHFMNNPTVPKEKISAMVNLDMIGRMKEMILIASGYDTSPAWDEILDRANEGLDLEIKKSGGGFGGSDHTSFYKDDIPVLFFFTGAHDDYNTPYDDWDSINAEGEAIILEYVAMVIEGIGNADESPPFTRSHAGQRGGGRSSLSVYMGTVPDFTHEGEGFAIMGTKGGSPAEKAGLKKGDIITGMDGKEVRTIYDFMGVLSDKKPGDVITVVVQREGAELSLPVTLVKKD
jgi:hypothetical protein